MLHRVLLVLILFAKLSPNAYASPYPKNFYVEYQRLTQGTLFHVMQADGTRFGKVERDTNKNDEELLFRRFDERLIAKAVLEKIGSVTTAWFTSASGEPLGSFSATIYNIYPAEFNLYSNEGLVIAKGEMNWIGTCFRLFDPENRHREFAFFCRPRFKLHSDSWHAEVIREGIIDPVVLILIGAYKTSLNLGLEGYKLQPLSSL